MNPRVAVVGTGMIGTVHARSARSAGAEVVGVAASNAERAAEAAARLGVPRAYPSAQEAVTDPYVDVVHVCTPNDLHAPLAVRALERGAHVVLEKPVATTTRDAERIRAAAAAQGRVVAVPFVYRYHPMVREARARLRAGGLGEVRVVHGSYLQDWLVTPSDSNWRVDAGRGGASRAFADIGSHWWDLAEFLVGQRLEPTGAVRRTFLPARPGVDRVTTEDALVAVFSGSAGAIGSVVVSQVSPGRKNRLWLQVDGAEASVVFDQEEPETLWLGRRAGSQVLARDPAVLASDAARLCVVPAGHPQGYLECFNAFVADAYATMRGERPEGLPTIEDGLRTMRVTDRVLALCAAAEAQEAR